MSLESVRPVIARLCDKLGCRAAYLKHFVQDRAGASDDVDEQHHSAKPWIGEAVEPELMVLENELRFVVRPYDGFAVGLFLDQRDNRRRVREMASGRRVLNLFSYTCGFSVAAAAGGATEVASVDLSKRYLEWGKENFAANDFSTKENWFFCSDVFEFYKRAERRGRRYDLIIIDPPTFARMRRPKRVFNITEKLDDLVAGAVRLLDADGAILLSTNCRVLTHERLYDSIQSAIGTGRIASVTYPELPVDFAGDPDYAKAVVAFLK